MQSSRQEPEGAQHIRRPEQEDIPMTTFAQRITAATTALTLSLALIAGTVHTPAPMATTTTQQEMI